MAGKRVTPECLKVYFALRDGGDTWRTVSQIADAAGVKPRTARNHLKVLAGLGIAVRCNVVIWHRYRLADQPPESASEYLRRLEEGTAVLEAEMEPVK
jgi:DNA-binding transcriptional ArsR family regulator